MKRFVEGADRGQSSLFPECLDDWIDEDNPVRVIDVFVDALDLGALDFGGVDPKATGRPLYHPSILLKLYVYGYLNLVQSSRRLERKAGRNVEVVWLTGRRTGYIGCYSDMALRRVWGAERLSCWLTTLLHRFPDDTPFDERTRENQLDYLARSDVAQASLAEQYVGLPFED